MKALIVILTVILITACTSSLSYSENAKSLYNEDKLYCTKDETCESSLLDGVMEDIYNYDFESVPKGAFPVIPRDMSYADLGDEYICNETRFEDKYLPLSMTESETVATFSNSENCKEVPIVLIIHTHTTEAYNDQGEYYNSPLSNFARSHDESENVISIGQTVADILNQRGIYTLHAKVYHDDVSYNDSYANSENTIKSYLEKYPSIKYVFDIHRDALMLSDGSTLRPICESDGKIGAQVMFVVGTNEVSGDDWDWQKNLAMAQTLRHRLNGEYENLVRPTYLRRASYNQKYSEHALLIEMGAAGNTLAEAQHSAKIVAEAIAELIKGN